MENHSSEAFGLKKIKKKSICFLEIVSRAVVAFSSRLSLVIWVKRLALSDSEMI